MIYLLRAWHRITRHRADIKLRAARTLIKRAEQLNNDGVELLDRADKMSGAIR